MVSRMKDNGLEATVVVVIRIQRDSKEEKKGRGIFEILRVDRYITASPPPLAPVIRGELIMEKLGGVRLFSTDGGVSIGSHVSERERMSR